MNILLDRVFESCLVLANRIWWHSDHYSFRVVDGRQLRPDDYRAAGCMRLVRAAEHGFGATTRAQPCVNRPVVFRRGIAPAASIAHRSDTVGLPLTAPHPDTPARHAVARSGASR
jgi:hypothetical protein